MIFTKEQLQNLIEFNSSDSDGQANAESWEVRKLAEMAMEGMEAQQVVSGEMTPEMMRAVQLNSELGSYAAENLSGAYALFAEFWRVASNAAPQPLTTSERAELENYRNAQQVVPGEMTAGIAVKYWVGGRGSIESFVAGWNAGRAAMQSAAVKDVLPEPIKDNHLNSGPDADDYYSGYQEGWNECLETISTGKQED